LLCTWLLWIIEQYRNREMLSVLFRL